MKQIFTFFAVMMMAIALPIEACAYDFSAVAPSGQTLYYEIVDNESVSVTFPGTYWDGYTKPTGALIIPSTVTINTGQTNHTYTVTSIGNYAFIDCIGLTSITLSDSVFSIGNYSFCGCNGLTSIILPNNITSIGMGAFQNCNNLASVTIGEGVTTIGFDAFYHCTSLTSIVIPDGVTSIYDNAFSECSNMLSLVIGSGVSSIGSSAFQWCSNLISITTRATVAPVIGYLAFNGVPINNPVIVPCGCLSSYYSEWNNYTDFSFVESGDSYELFVSTADCMSTMGQVNVITAPSCQTPTAVFNAVANDGYHFDHWSDGNTDNPRILTLTSDTTIVGYFAIVFYDTIIDHDTTYVDVPYPVHDTTIVHDTTYVNVPYPVHDTAIVHDTTFVNVTYPVHDTTTIVDTMTITDTITVVDTLWMTQYDTVWLHDTIVIHDTIYVHDEGIEDVDILNARIFQRDGRIVVESGDGGPLGEVRVFDVTGRMLTHSSVSQQGAASSPNLGEQFGWRATFEIPTSGTYIVKIGDHPAKKIVVVR